MGYGYLSGGFAPHSGGLTPRVRRPDGSESSREESRDVLRSAGERAESRAPALLPPIVWLACIGLMAIDVGSGFSGGGWPRSGGPCSASSQCTSPS